MVACKDKVHTLTPTNAGITVLEPIISTFLPRIGRRIPVVHGQTRPQTSAGRTIPPPNAGDRHRSTLVDTPAAPFHTPVMPAEVVEAIRVVDGGKYADCNVGEGGHAEAILRAADGVSLVGLDLDRAAMGFTRRRLAEFADMVELTPSNFSRILDITGEGALNGALFDLGVSSLQLGTPDRGFSFRTESPLDMRFNPETGLTARDIVNRYSQRDLEAVIRKYGEEPRARSIAHAICEHRPIYTTTELADVVRRAARWSSRSRVNPATRTFQALRMEVNGELDSLEVGLGGAVRSLRPGGRLVVISYHSLEDRVVKNFIRNEASSCICPPELPVCACQHTATLRRISRRVVTPSKDEIQANPRARSARMRIAERL